MIVHAPGKLVLIGEYAVLDGAGAVVAAVDRGVGVERVRIDGPLQISTPGDSRFVAAALEGATGAYRFFDWNPPATSGKAGFGGSAAATVAALAASGRPLSLAYTLHHRVQGSGSGVDVFASIHGDVRRFPDGASCRPPPMSVVWSGESALTGPRVQRYLSWRGRDAFAARTAELVSSFDQDPVGVMRENARMLLDMAVAAGVDYDRAALARIRQHAAAAGGAAKASGAGGGDIAVAIFADHDRKTMFEREILRDGLQLIPVDIAPGVANVNFLQQGPSP